MEVSMDAQEPADNTWSLLFGKEGGWISPDRVPQVGALEEHFRRAIDPYIRVQSDPDKHHRAVAETTEREGAGKGQAISEARHYFRVDAPPTVSMQQVGEAAVHFAEQIDWAGYDPTVSVSLCAWPEGPILFTQTARGRRW
jgi:hypothetical protein